MKKEKIDFVILWVDGSDPKWLDEKNKYSNNQNNEINRFRDYETLNYLFRGIEEYASWVNKVFFITWGHLPKWLNTENKKLRIVKHEEFIPKEYLPTFNSNVIELNLHRIKDLSEKFVLFNDDLFILQKLKPCYFFKNDLPADIYVEYVRKNCSKRHITIRNNNLKILNKHFLKSTTIKKNLFKTFNIRYKTGNFKTLINLKNKNYGDFVSYHLTQSFLKTTFIEVWNKEEKLLDNSCYNKFRSNSDIGRGIFRSWQLLSGNFSPFQVKSLGKYYILQDDNQKLLNTISKRSYKIICINDSSSSIDFEKAKRELKTAFLKIFPNKSSFEK